MAKNKETAETSERTGVCKFCGQGKYMTVPTEWSEAQLDAEATLTCTCDAGRDYRHKIEKEKALEKAIEHAKNYTENLFGTEAPSCKQILDEAFPHLAGYGFDEIVIKYGNVTAKAKLKDNSFVIEKNQRLNDDFEVTI